MFCSPIAIASVTPRPMSSPPKPTPENAAVAVGSSRIDAWQTPQLSGLLARAPGVVGDVRRIPEELSRMVDAEVLVGDGETAVLGGLQREAGEDGNAGVPGLRRAPLFGGLFGKKSKVGAEEELLVFVTPRVLD